MRKVVKALEPARLHPSDAVAALDEVVELEKLVGAAKALLAPRAAGAGVWRRDGARDAADWLARKAGTTKATAVEMLSTGSRLADQPSVEAAVRSGSLSLAQAAVVSDAVAADP